MEIQVIDGVHRYVFEHELVADPSFATTTT
jgi:hypothetical protein